MANTKISGLTEDTAPHRTNDYLPTYDASAITTKKVTLRNVGVIPLYASVFNFAPADATTYFIGPWETATPPSTGGSRRIYIPRTGIITRTSIFLISVSGGSNETSTISLRLNNTSDTTITSSFATNATAVFANNSMNLSVSIGDYVEAKWVTPTYATNPTGLYFHISILLE